MSKNKDGKMGSGTATLSPTQLAAVQHLVATSPAVVTRPSRAL